MATKMKEGEGNDQVCFYRIWRRYLIITWISRICKKHRCFLQSCVHTSDILFPDYARKETSSFTSLALSFPEGLALRRICANTGHPIVQGNCIIPTEDVLIYCVVGTNVFRYCCFFFLCVIEANFFESFAGSHQDPGLCCISVGRVER